MLIRILLALMLIANLAGCATTQKKSMLEDQVQQYEARIGELEKAAKEKDAKMKELEKQIVTARTIPDEIAAPESLPPTKKSEVKTNMTPKNIQTALKNAGLYQGAVDGKLGKNTKEAIKEFQKLNGLKSDGIVGKKTWVKLSEFLY